MFNRYDPEPNCRNVMLLDSNGNDQLLLTSVKPESGPPTSGWVVNGNWFWRRQETTEYALRSEQDANEDAVTVTEREKLNWYSIRVKPARHSIPDDMIPF